MEESIVNKVFCQDNLEFSKKIDTNSVDLIYSDILYGTGRDFGEFEDINFDHKEVRDFYYDRIKEFYRILKDSGSIYFHMDFKISHWVRCIFDEVFGHYNFRNEIIWPREMSKGAKSRSKHFCRNSDVILFFAKDRNKYKWNGCFKPYSKEYIKKRFRKDEQGKYFMDCPLGSYEKHDMEGLKKKNRIYITRNNKYRYKKFLDEMDGVAVGDVWDDISPLNSLSREKTGYPTQKPIELMKRIITSSSNEGDIVFDPFCGSGSFLVASELLRRKYVGIDVNQKATNITKNRLSNVRN